MIATNNVRYINVGEKLLKEFRIEDSKHEKQKANNIKKMASISAPLKNKIFNPSSPNKRKVKTQVIK